MKCFDSINYNASWIAVHSIDELLSFHKDVPFRARSNAKIFISMIVLVYTRYNDTIFYTTRKFLLAASEIQRTASMPSVVVHNIAKLPYTIDGHKLPTRAAVIPSRRSPSRGVWLGCRWQESFLFKKNEHEVKSRIFAHRR